MTISSLVPTSTTPDPKGKFPVLLSYAFARQKPEDFALFANNPHVEVLLDSGAFTALNSGEEIHLKDYMAFLEMWRDKLFGYLALDVLGDPVGTDVNLRVMRNAGFKPIPVHVRGDDEARMDELFEWSDWVALGGLRRPHTGWGPKEYVKQKMIWAKGRNVHWLGYTNHGMVRGFRPYSCDSSNWAIGARWGVLHVHLGGWKWSRRGKLAEGALDQPFCKEEIEMFRQCGFEPKDVRNPRNWRLDVKNGATRDTHVPFRVTALSYVSWIRHMRAVVGTREFLACSMIGGEHLYLLNMIEETAP